MGGPVGTRDPPTHRPRRKEGQQWFGNGVEYARTGHHRPRTRGSVRSPSPFAIFYYISRSSYHDPPSVHEGPPINSRYVSLFPDTLPMIRSNRSPSSSFRVLNLKDSSSMYRNRWKGSTLT